MPVEGFRNHVTTDGSVLEILWQVECVWAVRGAAGIMMKKWATCMGRTVRRTLISRCSVPAGRTELTVFLSPIGRTTTAHQDKTGLTDGLWMGEE